MTTAKIVLSILKNGRIDSEIDFPINLAEDNMPAIDLINAIVLTHKKRYEQCVSEEERASELNNAEVDYCKIFGENGQYMTRNLFTCCFKLVVLPNAWSASYRENCIALMENLKSCQHSGVQYALYVRVMSTIISCHLYGREPYDSILEECINIIDSSFGDVEPEELAFLG